MSDMHFREPNQVKWQGSRPGHNGTQVHLSQECVAIVPTSFYTVPAGKTLFITYAFMAVANPIASSNFLAIYTAVPALYRFIFKGYNAINTAGAACIANFWPPIEVPAGFHLYYSQTFNCLLSYVIHGWVE